MKRRKMTKKGSKRLFTATADKIKKINTSPPPVRGGIRL